MSRPLTAVLTVASKGRQLGSPESMGKEQILRGDTER